MGKAGAPSSGRSSKGEAIPRLYNVLEIERDFSKITVHTREQRTPDGDWSGHNVWPNPNGSESTVAYYAIDLTQDG